MRDFSLLDKLQDELRPWIARNFGQENAVHQTLGVVEELGEYIEAKKKEEWLDAIGDVVVFMASWCNARGVRLSEIVGSEPPPNETTPGYTATAGLLAYVGRFARANLKLEQNIRGSAVQHLDAARHALRRLYWVISEWCTTANCDMPEQIAWTVWQKVKQRDWVAERAARKAK